MATTYTTLSKLAKPGISDAGWGLTLNAMIDSVDGRLGHVDVAAWATGGTGTYADPWTGWDTAITWSGGRRYVFRAGFFSATAGVASAGGGPSPIRGGGGAAGD